MSELLSDMDMKGLLGKLDTELTALRTSTRLTFQIEPLDRMSVLIEELEAKLEEDELRQNVVDLAERFERELSEYDVYESGIRGALYGLLCNWLSDVKEVLK